MLVEQVGAGGRHEVGQGTDVTSGDVANPHRLGNVVVAPHEPGRADRAARVGRGQDCVGAKPRRRGQRAVSGPRLVAIPVGGGMEHDRLDPLA